mmetsp:Transcript_9996/g.29684  ORF Transcript_9996/g.29684 Transcript_9996/m.29684 type:complete len:104 (+) Transcript_9996:401-712(+)
MSEVDKKSPAFIPQSITLALQQLSEHNKAESSKQVEQLATLMDSQQEMFKAVQTVQKKLGRVEEAPIFPEIGLSGTPHLTRGSRTGSAPAAAEPPAGMLASDI